MVCSFNTILKESYSQTIGYPHVSHGYNYVSYHNYICYYIL
nr:MAG TPA: hypothetical protein [Bacteriophage sp.]